MPLQQQIIAAARANNIAELQQLDRESSAVERQKAIAADNFSLFNHAVSNDYTEVVMWVWHQASYRQQQQLQQLPCFNNINDELKQQLLANAHQMPEVMDDDNDYLNQMPGEVIAHIYSFVPPQERYQASCVNRGIFEKVKNAAPQHWMQDSVNYIKRIFRQKKINININLHTESQELIIRLLRLAGLYEQYFDHRENCDIAPWISDCLNVMRDFINEDGLNALIKNAILYQPDEQLTLDDMIHSEHFIIYLTAALATNNIEFIDALLDIDLEKHFVDNKDSLDIYFSRYKEEKDINTVIIAPLCILSLLQCDTAFCQDYLEQALQASRLNLVRNNNPVSIPPMLAMAEAAASNPNFGLDNIHAIGLNYVETIKIAARIGRPALLSEGISYFKYVQPNCNYLETLYLELLSIALRNHQPVCAETISVLENKNIAKLSRKYTYLRVQAFYTLNDSIRAGELDTLIWLHRNPHVHIDFEAGRIGSNNNFEEITKDLNAMRHFVELASEHNHHDMVEWLYNISNKRIKRDLLCRLITVYKGKTKLTESFELFKKFYINHPTCPELFDLPGLFNYAVELNYESVITWCYEQGTAEQRLAYDKQLQRSETINDQTKQAIMSQPIVKQVVKQLDVKKLDRRNVLYTLYGKGKVNFKSIIKNEKNHAIIAEQIINKIEEADNIEFIYTIFELIGIGRYDEKHHGIAGDDAILSQLRKRKRGLGLLSTSYYRETNDTKKIADAAIKKAYKLLQAENQPLSDPLKDTYLQIIQRQTIRNTLLGKEPEDEKQARAEWIILFKELFDELEKGPNKKRIEPIL